MWWLFGIAILGLVCGWISARIWYRRPKLNRMGVLYVDLQEETPLVYLGLKGDVDDLMKQKHVILDVEIVKTPK